MGVLIVELGDDHEALVVSQVEGHALGALGGDLHEPDVDRGLGDLRVGGDAHVVADGERAVDDGLVEAEAKIVGRPGGGDRADRAVPERGLPLLVIDVGLSPPRRDAGLEVVAHDRLGVEEPAWLEGFAAAR